MDQHLNPPMLTDIIGYVAASLVFATFCMQRMVSLRSIAIASNLAFIAYGFTASLWPILVLHSLMLPLNIQRCWQSAQGRRGVATADAGGPVSNRASRPLSARSVSNGIAAVRGRLRCWWERVELRRELSSMSVRDFGDVKVPPSLTADEVRRWPWQGSSPQWRAAASGRAAAYRDDFADLTRRN
jgi:hypothetical protein